MPDKSTPITVLIPLPVYYNANAEGVREPIEDEKFAVTAEEISHRYGGGVLHRFLDEMPIGFWWNKGILSRDAMCAFEVDMLDTEENKLWIKTYAKDVLLKRFRQDAIYLRFIGPVESLEVTEETIIQQP